MPTCLLRSTMVHYPADISYSVKYANVSHEFRHLILPKNIAKDMCKLTACERLLKEAEWRSLGVQQSYGWEHYEIHRQEPHILLFRRPLPPSAQIDSTVVPDPAVTSVEAGVVTAAGAVTAVEAGAVKTSATKAVTTVDAGAVTAAGAVTSAEAGAVKISAPRPTAHVGAGAAKAVAVVATAEAGSKTTTIIGAVTTVAGGAVVKTCAKFPYVCPQCLGQSRRKPPMPCARCILIETSFEEGCRASVGNGIR